MSSPLTILLQEGQLLDLSKKNIVEIDKKGEFSFRLRANFIQELNLVYTEFIYLLLSPGDSLHIELDDQKISHPDLFNTIETDKPFKKNRQKDFYKFPNSELGKTNELINNFMRDFPSDLYIYQFASNAIKDNNPQQYTEYIKLRQKNYSTFFDQYQLDNETTPLFNMWVVDHLKYSGWSDLMRYRWLYPMYNKINEKDYVLSEGYFDFLSEYDMNDVSIFSLNHFSFLHELYMYNGHYKNEDLNLQFQNYYKANPTIDKRKALEFLQSRIEKNYSGFTKDVFISKYYHLYLEWQMIEFFEATYDSTYTNESYFKMAIKNKHSEMKRFLSNQNVEKYNLLDIKSEISANLIDSISKIYKGKVVYIDFWAPWCLPCMAELPHMKEIQEYFFADDVVFLFLANRTKTDSWKATIANKNINGEHILLTDNQFNVLSKNLNIGGIPHYTLLDRKGNIIAKKAAHPSQKETIIKEISQLLQKK